MDRKNQQVYYQETNKNNPQFDPTIYPNDDIRGMSVQDIQYIAMRVGSHEEVATYLREHIGKNTKNKPLLRI